MGRMGASLLLKCSEGLVYLSSNSRLCHKASLHSLSNAPSNSCSGKPWTLADYQDGIVKTPPYHIGLFWRVLKPNFQILIMKKFLFFEFLNIGLCDLGF